ncbi:MAG: PKD domain-containing protein [Anaerolineae bacterium]|nr:PKD domain-containing protein [Anaerolineae bacterium]
MPLNQAFIQCGPTTVRRYDLSRAAADRVHAGFIQFTPPLTAQCTLNFINQFNDLAQTKLKLPQIRNLPGCDHPGDSAIAADTPSVPAVSWITLPEGTSPPTKVAVLNTGFVAALARLLLQDLGERVTLIEFDFDPVVTAAQYPVLVIPSGGLFGLENSTFLRVRLEEYTRQGGTIIVLAQQHGYEYHLLPGGEVNGAGWQEDTACLSAPLDLAAHHPALSGFDHSRFSASARGYFISAPAESMLLLTRTFDHQPVALIYPYGQGRVMATTLAEDWASATGQVSPDTHVFLRDLLSWAISRVEMPTFAPGETIDLTVPITNRGRGQASAIRLTLVSPDRRIVQEQVLDKLLEKGEVTLFNFKTTAQPPLGIWQLQATMLNNLKWAITRRSSITYFIVADPSAWTSLPQLDESKLAKPILTQQDVAIEAGLDKMVYTTGETATLTLTLTNHSAAAAALYARVRHGDFEAAHPISLANKEERTLVFTIPSVSTSHPLAYGIYDRASECGLRFNTLPFYTVNPAAPLAVYPDKRLYQPGDPVRVTVVTPYTGSLQVQAPGFSQTLTLPGHDTGFQFTLPPDLLRGTYALDYALNGLSHRVPFDVDGPWVRVIEARLLNLPHPGDKEVKADLFLTSDTPLDLALRMGLRYPDGATSQEQVQQISLAANAPQKISVTLPLSTTQTGLHHLAYQLTDPANPAQVYATGLEEFDLGTVAVLAVRTDQGQYVAPTDVVTSEVMLYATTATTATLDLDLDDGNTWSHPLTLITGSKTVTFNLPGLIQPGSRQLQARVTAHRLTSAAQTNFEYATEAPDLQLSLPVLESSIVSETVRLKTDVRNFGDFPAAATTVAFWDGDPNNGGSLIEAVPVPPLPDNEGFTAIINWDLHRKAGLHRFYAIADSENTVAEYYEDNNIRIGGVNVPSFVAAVVTDRPIYDRDETVIITTTLTSLRPKATLNLSATTFINFFYGDYDDIYAHTYEQPIVLPPDKQVTIVTPWIAANARGGDYGARVHVTGEYEYFEIGGDQAFFSINHSANFTTTTPVTGTAPLTVTFMDRSSPVDEIKTWQWDFGDGGMATEMYPTHVYTGAGSYTVTLIASTGQVTYTEIKPNYILVLAPKNK